MNAAKSLAFLISCLPDALQDELASQDLFSLTEIRLRANRPVQFNFFRGLAQGRFTPDGPQLANISEALSEHGLYARFDEARRGFITLRGGHRLGLCGKVQWEENRALQLSDIGSVCLRIAREHQGAAAALLPYVSAADGLPSLLLLGAPATGKTTLLRDLARTLSNGGTTVAINDERGELAACQGGVAQLDVGASTDVLDGCQKAYGIRWLIRSMAPQLIVTDEIAGDADAAAILEARASGIGIMASAHAGSVESFFSRPDFACLSRHGVFDIIALLKPGKIGEIQCVYNKGGALWRLPPP